MKKLFKTNILNTRLGLFSLIAILLWLKNLFAYAVDFHLRLENINEYFILLINPIATTVFLLAIALYVRRKKASYITMMIIYFLMSLLLFSNVVYYREFTDFITVNTMLGAGKVASGLGESALRLFRPYDVIYFLDFIIIGVLLLTKKIKTDARPVRARVAVSVTLLSVVFFLFNLFMAETERPQLLGRQFSRDYIVKFLGLNAFTVYDGITTYQTNQVRAEASANDMKQVEDYVKQQYAAPDDSKFGIAKGKNVIYIHLESFQQFLVNYKLKDENGVEHEVTPFINSLYNSKSTFSFDNFFHQVGQGKTSDAETLLENSLFGLDQGSLFTQVGGKNTFEAAPDILKQTQGYTSAAFHGNAGNFWNRNETYKRLGYDYFFDASYYDTSSSEDMAEYGLLDKPFFEQSESLLSSLPQPFYTKFITVGNHYPYKMNQDLVTIDKAETGDASVDNYFQTARYADEAIEQFFNQLKELGLYDNTMIVLYGDHYGISDNHNKAMEQVIGKDITPYDSTNLQRVPLLIHVPGMQGETNHTYGGQIDLLPTVLHLLGIDTQNFIQSGSDLLSEEHNEIVPFRNGDFVSPTIYSINEKLYDNKTGLPLDDSQLELANAIKNEVEHKLGFSDKVVNGDLLRFYTPPQYTPVDPSQYNYFKDTHVESN